MEQFTTILEQATRAMPREYFSLPIHGADPVYRERVYCYELYHQLRTLWPGLENTRYRLNGEVDKTAHPYFANEKAPKPDLLVHVPGTENNYAVIEVKRSDPSRRGVQKDLTTLSRFKNDFGYLRAIYLLFGDDAEAAMGLVLDCAAELDNGAQVEIWLHTAALTKATLAAQLKRE
jgi:hypothetical protein